MSANNKIYYGTTSSGHRLHFGTEVMYPDPGNRREWVVISRCANRMYSHDPDEPSPGRVTEFCKTCFRAIAWSVYEDQMKIVATQRGEPIVELITKGKKK